MTGKYRQLHFPVRLIHSDVATSPPLVGGGKRFRACSALVGEAAKALLSKMGQSNSLGLIHDPSRESNLTLQESRACLGHVLQFHVVHDFE